MKKKIILTLLPTVFLISCQKNKKEEYIPYCPIPTLDKAGPQKWCYQYVHGKDTIDAHFIIEKEKVIGDLAYHFYEKDKNTGTVEGAFKGDTLIANYTFISEGASFFRQVVFLRNNDNTLSEGYGESEEKEGKMVFKNIKKLNFSGITMKEIRCQ